MGGKISANRIEKVFKALDTSQDGYIVFEEVLPVAEVCGFEVKSLRAAYAKADKSRDGYLDRKEVERLFSKLHITPEQFAALENSLFTIIIQMPKVSVHQMKGDQKSKDSRKLLVRGPMQVVSLSGGKVMLTVGHKWNYVLSKRIPSLRIDKLFFCFPAQNNLFYGLVIPEKTDEMALEAFQDVLERNSAFTFKQFKGQKAPSSAGEGTVVESKSSWYASLKAKAKKTMDTVKKTDTFQKASKVVEQVKESDAYKKTAEGVGKAVKTVQESKTYQEAKDKAIKTMEKVKASETYKSAAKAAKEGSEFVKEQVEKGAVYVQKVVDDNKGKSVGDKISAGVTVAADAAVTGIGYTAKFAAATVRQTAQILKSTLKPREEKREVSERTKKYVKTAAAWSGKAVVVSKHAASTAVAVADALATKLAEALKSTQIYKDNEDKMNSKGVQDAKKVVKAGLEGSIKIVDAMIDAGVMFIAEVAVASAEVVEHTQGEEAGAVAKDASEIVKNTAGTVANMRYVGLGRIAKQAVLGTTVEMLGTEEEKKQLKEGKEDNMMANVAVNMAVAQASTAK
mmetsp:Transcript_18056/g.27081  ORF Transcript_18056/g.27081 Transcript_18056/m.27081 type:complete len:567 (-) Transcript_18056:53-1753(-)